MNIQRQIVLISASAPIVPSERPLIVSTPIIAALKIITNRIIPWNTLPSTTFFKPLIITSPQQSKNINEDFTIHNGDRIAQLIVAPVTQGQFVRVAKLDETERGAGGFGSTGVKA